MILEDQQIQQRNSVLRGEDCSVVPWFTGTNLIRKQRLFPFVRLTLTRFFSVKT